MTKTMKMIDGTAFHSPQTGRNARNARKGISALGGRQVGFYGIRNKETGEIHVPSVYYVDFCRGESQTYWDSETNTTYLKGIWTIIRFNADIKLLLKRYRKKEKDFEIIAFSMKENKGVPYNYGYGGINRIYEAGPSPMLRDDTQNIQQIVVLQTSLTPSDKDEVQVIKKNAIVALEVKEV